MPFDGNDPISAVRLIDAVLDVLGPKGERWIQRRPSNAAGDHCILGALAYSRRRLRTPKGDLAAHYIRQAISETSDLPHYWLTSIALFNDYRGTKFRHVREGLQRARELAVADAP